LFSDGFLGLVGPNDLVICQDGLTLVVQDPLYSGLLDCIHEVFVSVSDYAFHGFDHLFLKISQPHFNVEPGADPIDQLDDFPLCTDQPFYGGGSFLFDMKRADSLKQFADMFLYDMHVVGVG
jgi:hypothetical protein